MGLADELNRFEFPLGPRLVTGAGFNATKLDQITSEEMLESISPVGSEVAPMHTSRDFLPFGIGRFGFADLEALHVPLHTSVPNRRFLKRRLRTILRNGRQRD